MSFAQIPARKGLNMENRRNMYPTAIVNPTRGIAAMLRIRDENTILLKLDATKGITPSWAVRLRAKISLIRRGRRGRKGMTFGKNKIMERVAANVIWKPMEKRLAGLKIRRMKALMARVFRRLAFRQMSLPTRNAIAMMVALITEGLPSTSRA